MVVPPFMEVFVVLAPESSHTVLAGVRLLVRMRSRDTLLWSKIDIETYSLDPPPKKRIYVEVGKINL